MDLGGRTTFWKEYWPNLLKDWPQGIRQNEQGGLWVQTKEEAVICYKGEAEQSSCAPTWSLRE